jgi:hypothetical protein
MARIFVAFAAAALAALSIHADAATVQVDGSGKLIGATGVTVNGSLPLGLGGLLSPIFTKLMKRKG